MADQAAGTATPADDPTTSQGAPGDSHRGALYYDPYDASITADPYPFYARLRDEAPLYYNERYDFWALSRHADVENALLDWQTFSNRRSDILELVKSDFDMPKGVMMFEDPPEHTMLRGLMSRVFTLGGWSRSKTRSGGTASTASTRTSAATASTSSLNSPPRCRCA